MQKVVCGIFLLGNSYLDLKKKEISLNSCVLMAVIKVIFCLAKQRLDLLELLSGCLPGAVLLLLGMLGRGQIGGGDGLAIMVIGCFMGFRQTIQILCIGFFCAAVFSIFFLFLGKVTRNTRLPFLPFLLLGFVIKEISVR